MTYIKKTDIKKEKIIEYINNLNIDVLIYIFNNDFDKFFEIIKYMHIIKVTFIYDEIKRRGPPKNDDEEKEEETDGFNANIDRAIEKLKNL
jgi:hypothetical protein